jgi:transposase
MDNLSVHKSKVSLAEMHRLGLQPIYNVPYSPDFNPIELVFAQVKHYFKAMKTNAIVNGGTEPANSLIY